MNLKLILAFFLICILNILAFITLEYTFLSVTEIAIKGYAYGGQEINLTHWKLNIMYLFWLFPLFVLKFRDQKLRIVHLFLVLYLCIAISYFVAHIIGDGAIDFIEFTCHLPYSYLTACVFGLNGWLVKKYLP